MAWPSPFMHSGERSMCADSSNLMVTSGRDGTPVSCSMTSAIICLASHTNSPRALSKSCPSLCDARLDVVSISMAAETMRVQPGANSVLCSASTMRGMTWSVGLLHSRSSTYFNTAVAMRTWAPEIG
eukprot:1283171-Amphidinium_carterae.1